MASFQLLLKADWSRVGVRLNYLAPCSPDLDPNEELLAKLKASLCKVSARPKEALWITIEEVPESPQELRR